MNFAIVEGAEGTSILSWNKPSDISGAVYLSYNIKRGELFTDPDFGLDLSDIRKITDQNIEIIKQRILEATNWMLVTEKARAISVEVERDNLTFNRVNIATEIIQSDSVPIILNNFVTVGV